MKLTKILLFISSLNLIYALDLSGLNSNQEWKTLQNNDVSIKTTQYLGITAIEE